MNTPNDLLNELAKTLAVLKAQQEEAAKKAVRPYYRIKYAEWVKNLIDNIIETGNVYMLPAVDVSPNTIKQQWYQGLAYLYEVLDPSYRDKAARIEACFDKRRGLIVAMKVESTLTAPVVYTKWKDDLLKWMETAADTGELWQKQGLALPDEDIFWLHDKMKPLEDLFAYDVDQRKGIINVVKI